MAGKVKLKFPVSLADTLNGHGSDLASIEREIGQNTTIRDLLAGINASDTSFDKAIFNPGTGKINDQLVVILNSRLLEGPDVPGTEIADGDSIIILPLYAGG